MQSVSRALARVGSPESHIVRSAITLKQRQKQEERLANSNKIRDGKQKHDNGHWGSHRRQFNQPQLTEPGQRLSIAVRLMDAGS